MQVTCDYCNDTFSKGEGAVKKSKHNFCNRSCYHSYRREHFPKPHKSDYSIQKKLNEFAEKRRRLIGGENVSRICTDIP